MSTIYQHFATDRPTPWRRYLVGGGSLEHTGSSLRLVTTDTTHRHYTDAQLDDAYKLPRHRYAWRPPLRLTVRARFSHPQEQLRGTAGFGFWNYPSPAGGHPWPTLPRAIWFFLGSAPSDLKLDMQTPGHSCWKAATIDTWRPDALALLPVALPAVALMNLPPLYRALWPPIQRAVGVGEAPVQADMTAWHIYTIDWGIRSASFFVDGKPVLEHAPAPGGPLCFVMWLDNQYAIVKPWGRFGWGLLDIPGRQWLEAEWLAIERTHA
jgi:hypothetical protein